MTLGFPRVQAGVQGVQALPPGAHLALLTPCEAAKRLTFTPMMTTMTVGRLALPVLTQACFRGPSPRDYCQDPFEEGCTDVRMFKWVKWGSGAL